MPCPAALRVQPPEGEIPQHQKRLSYAHRQVHDPLRGKSGLGFGTSVENPSAANSKSYEPSAASRTTMSCCKPSCLVQTPDISTAQAAVVATSIRFVG